MFFDTSSKQSLIWNRSFSVACTNSQGYGRLDLFDILGFNVAARLDAISFMDTEAGIAPRLELVRRILEGPLLKYFSSVDVLYAN